MPRRTTRKQMEAEIGWAPPAGLRIEIGVTRGDVFMKAEATPTEAMNVARLLVAMVRQLASENPDVLPHADSVPGGHVLFPGSEDWDSKARQRRLGFTG